MTYVSTDVPGISTYTKIAAFQTHKLSYAGGLNVGFATPGFIPVNQILVHEENIKAKFPVYFVFV